MSKTAAYLYDAVQVYAKALKAVLDINLDPLSNTSILVDHMRDSKYTSKAVFVQY